MNEDTSQTGQQGYGSDQDPTQPNKEPQAQDQRNAQPIGGNDGSQGTGTTMSSGSSTGDAGASSTGQASYGNSGQADVLSQGQQGQAQSQNSSSLGQESDLGESEGRQSADHKEDRDSGETAGITDIEIERSQGREADIEGTAL